jgi:D-alanyl-D-alanine endopeptidase (penicillin-binding protein 7)
MTTRLLLSNIVSYGLQVSLLVLAAATLARVFRLEEPRALLAYWRALLLVCLVLPLAQPWKTVPPPLVAAATIETLQSGLPSAEFVTAGAPVAAPWPAMSLVEGPVADLFVIALAGGIALRLVWLTIAACGLRRLWREASPLEPLPDSVRHAQEQIVTAARMFISPRVSSPITFGLFRPVVVFPPGVSRMPPHVQEAITCHELIHVRRRDWLAEIFEEAVRSVLWFLPAVWWLIGRIRLTREQVVDQEVIRLTDSRERYIDALLTFAVAGSRAAFAPASPFLRRHVLKKRVARILQEHTMTTRRLIASLTASTVVLALAATFAVRSFPLEAQGFNAADGTGPILLVSGGEHLVHGGLPEYPDRAREKQIEGDVVVEMSLNDRGEVSDARILSGPDELRKATLEAVLQWHYSPAVIRSTVTQATLRFRVPAQPKPDDVFEIIVEKDNLVEIEKSKEQVAFHDAEFKTLRKFVAIEDKAFEDKTFEGQPRLVDVRTERVSEATARELLAQAGVAIGNPLSKDAARRIRVIAVAMDEHFLVSFHKDREGGLVLTISTH